MRRLCAGITLLALLAGCGGGSGGGTSASAPPVSKIVSRAAAKTAALKSFHFSFATKNPPASVKGLNLTAADGDVRVPDALDAKVSGTLSGVSLSSELVFVQPHQYLKNPLSGKWQSFDTATSPIGYFDPAKGVLAVIKGATGLTLAGSETVDGAACYRLDGTVHARDVARFLATTGGSRAVDVELLVGKQDGYLHEIRLRGPVAAGEPKNVERDVTLSRFDEPVTVTAPKAG